MNKSNTSGKNACKIKICGLTRPQDIACVNEALPDYIGFVFAQSRRQVNPETAYALRSSLDARIQPVGVFVNESIPNILHLCRNNTIDLIQLHGDEDPAYIHKLNTELAAHKLSKPIIKAVRVKDAGAFKAVNLFESSYLLLDTYAEKHYGGTGKTFDWQLCRLVEKPFFLAGGINLENAETAIAQATPYCLDVSSGVETEGLKDKTKITELVRLVRSLRQGV